MKGDFSEVTYGYCKCGCGQRTNIAPYNHKKYGWIGGEPMRFLKGHGAKPMYGKDNPNYGKGLFGKDNPMHGVHKFGKDSPQWKGGVAVKKEKNTSYVRVYRPEHTRSDGKYVLEHILIAERMTGKPLPEGSVVHHIDGNGLNNNEDNLMIFTSSADHLKFHAKERQGAHPCLR